MCDGLDVLLLHDSRLLRAPKNQKRLEFGTRGRELLVGMREPKGITQHTHRPRPSQVVTWIATDPARRQHPYGFGTQ